MTRSLSISAILLALLVSLPSTPAEAAGKSGHKVSHGGKFGHNIGQARSVSHGFRHGHGFGHRFDPGFGVVGFGGVSSDVWGFAELYRELLNNIPYFALHPPVYYSHPVPRTYGYSPFAYPPYVMTPDPHCQPQPLEILNPHVPAPQEKRADAESERAVRASVQPEPLVIVNPFVTPRQAVVQQ